VVTVGRLDLNTEGLLLLTNDGELARALELPATGLKRTYRARAYGKVEQRELDKLRDGIVHEGVEYRAIIARLDRVIGSNTWIDMTLIEGKKREARRALESLGLRVNRLIRVGYGPLELGDLPEGEVAEESAAEVLAAFGDMLAAKRRPDPGDLGLAQGRRGHLAKPGRPVPEDPQDRAGRQGERPGRKRARGADAKKQAPDTNRGKTSPASPGGLEGQPRKRQERRRSLADQTDSSAELRSPRPSRGKGWARAKPPRPGDRPGRK
jgi:23S rRNA pseudouridine2605 synthase